MGLVGRRGVGLCWKRAVFSMCPTTMLTKQHLWHWPGNTHTDLSVQEFDDPFEMVGDDQLFCAEMIADQIGEPLP